VVAAVVPDPAQPAERAVIAQPAQVRRGEQLGTHAEEDLRCGVPAKPVEGPTNGAIRLMRYRR
jgi:hypothetical protein